MGEYEFYGEQGFTQPSLVDRRYAFFGGGPGSINDLRRLYYIEALSLDNNVNLSINDLEYRYYQGMGGVGSIQDMRSAYWSGEISPDPPDPPEEGLAAHFNFNDPGDTETFDLVANRRMALNSYEKVEGYSGQAISSTTSMSDGLATDGFLNRNEFTVAVRLQLDLAGGGVRFTAEDGTTRNVQLLSRLTDFFGSMFVSVVATLRIGGALKNAGGNTSVNLAESGLTPGDWFWVFLIFNGSTAEAYINNVRVKAPVAAVGEVDLSATMGTYVTAADAKVDDVRIYDYAMDEAKRLELIGE